jgi:hypothetical protein
MRVHPSALKHGVSPQDAIQAAEWPVWIEPLDEDGPIRRELRLGFDTGARVPPGAPSWLLGPFRLSVGGQTR